MKKLSIAALLIASTLAAPISTSMAAGPGAMLSDKSNYSDVVATVDASGKAMPDLSKVTNKSTINIVKLSSLKGYKANGALATSLSTNAKTVAALDTSVAANAALNAKLKAAGYKPTQVVAVSSDATGNVSVVVNDGK